MNKQLIVRADTLFNGYEFKKNRSVIIENNRIVDVTGLKKYYNHRGFVTPAFIDPHSHIGMTRHGEPNEEREMNDKTNHFTPHANPIDNIKFDDRAFFEAVTNGVLYSCALNGSGCLMGSRAMVIRNFAPDRRTAEFADDGYKIALGFNPKNHNSGLPGRPDIRSSLYLELQDRFNAVLAKNKQAEIKKELALIVLSQKKSGLSDREYELSENLVKLEYEAALTPTEKALNDLLSGRRRARVHVHMTDDVIFLIELARKYNLRVSAEHAGDISDPAIFSALRENNIPVVYGPIDALAYKTELKHKTPRNIAALVESGVFYGFMSDHPITQAANLRLALQHFLRFGKMDNAGALSIITQKNAQILDIDDQLGTIEPGKLASLVVWNGDPLHLSSWPTVVMGEGRVLTMA